jgi:hypothetical protein
MERLVDCEGTAFADGGELRVEGDDPRKLAVLVFPKMSATGMADGVFEKLAPAQLPVASPMEVTTEKVTSAGTIAARVRTDDEEAWKQAEVWALHIPAVAADRRVMLKIHYVGDALRIYNGETLVDDQIFNGDDFDVALWRIPAAEWGNLRVKVLPLSKEILPRLPEGVRGRVTGGDGELISAPVMVTPLELFEVRVK